ncbi:hypothetical protein PsorP6_017406 [Peronosclerospora sorghi]|uniref:Uncharacterized protein n=1 Tax=Peronosclerospora sorghi TaxID=230839 RepID=A0ACC0WMJ8_9STRA|nr:hypothetical protein PsorP6_017406 [Peronosclerospora sorghi]
MTTRTRDGTRLREDIRLSQPVFPLCGAAIPGIPRQFRAACGNPALEHDMPLPSVPLAVELARRHVRHSARLPTRTADLHLGTRATLRKDREYNRTGRCNPQ